MESITRVKQGMTASCDGCGNRIKEKQTRYIIVNNELETSILCADCAAIYMGETLSCIRGFLWFDQKGDDMP